MLAFKSGDIVPASVVEEHDLDTAGAVSTTRPYVPERDFTIHPHTDLPGSGGGSGDGVPAEFVASLIAAHEADTTPHPSYDVDLPSLTVLFENGLV